MDELEQIARAAEETNAQITADKSKQAKRAEEYILKETGQDVTKGAKVEVGEDGRIKVDRRSKKVINHVAVANEFVKLVNIAPGVSALSRQIISTKILNPGISYTGLGLIFKMRNEEIMKYEADGISRVKRYLVGFQVDEAVAKFNKDGILPDIKNAQGNKNSLLT